MVGLPPLIPDWDESKICYEYLDEHPYHLFEYSKMGYKTMIAQDYSAGIVFYLNCLGFNRSEADHIWSEPHLEMMDYLEKFMNAYAGE
ncbi:hypothetical protein KIN20_007276 [Parelaphostrongylus tenuis]|uniref:Uncharacterized protein n=1 Tax=Parelaphostrongylus tenuis TaxID=148309 RepID=A0AAD5M575_PARTN|nr:hypothetical protein KIN20_007276 [Parelaphostrongylus tenuis]